MSLSPPGGPAWRRRARPGREAEFASLDFETTGLDRERDAVVSFGVVPVRGGRVVVGEAVHQLMVPEVPSSPESMRIHGILPKDLEAAQPFAIAGRTLRDALAGRFLVAWFAGVELGFLGRLYGGRRRSWVRRTIDVRQMAIELEHQDQGIRQSLSSAAERYGVPVANPHEALDDAMVTAQLFLVLAARLEERGFGSARSFLRLTRV